MNATLLPHDFARQGVDHQNTLTMDADGALRCVWEGQFGPMLIEVKAGVVYVNGRVVEPAVPALPSSGGTARVFALGILR